MIELRLDLKPTPKRQIIKNNKIENDDKTKSFIKQIRSELLPKKIKLLTGPLSMTISFVYKRTKSQKHFEDHRYPKVRRPLIANLIRGLTESLKGIAYPDSSMICELKARKLVGKPEESNYIQVCIKRFDPQKSHNSDNNVEGETALRTSAQEADQFREFRECNVQGETVDHTSAREKRRKENQRKHREQQAKKHEKQRLERELRQEANRKAHRIKQDERNKLAKEESRKRSIEKLKAVEKSRAEDKAEKQRLEAERLKREKEDFVRRYLPPPRRWRSDDE